MVGLFIFERRGVGEGVPWREEVAEAEAEAEGELAWLSGMS